MTDLLPRDISVVIPSYNRLSQLARLVREWLAHEPGQIVVVLDGPHHGFDPHVHPFNHPDVCVIELPENLGLAMARIHGLEAVTRPITLLADDDVFPGAGVLRGHLAARASCRADIVVGYMPVALPPRRTWDQGPTYLYALEYQAATEVWETNPGKILTGLWNGNVTIDTALYRLAESTRPSVPLQYNEDLDLGLRLLGLGATAVFAPEARSTHLHARGFKGYWRESSARGRSIGTIEKRWGYLPEQLSDLVTTDQHPAPLALLVRLLSTLPPTAVKQLATIANGGLGIARLFVAQDALLRLVRRSEALRGYRQAISD